MQRSAPFAEAVRVRGFVCLACYTVAHLLSICTAASGVEGDRIELEFMGVERAGRAARHSESRCPLAWSITAGPGPPSARAAARRSAQLGEVRVALS